MTHANIQAHERTWIPSEEPYRVRYTTSAGPKLYGWATSSKTYATLEDAMAAAKNIKRVRSVEIHKATNYTRPYRWKRIDF